MSSIEFNEQTKKCIGAWLYRTMRLKPNSDSLSQQEGTIRDWQRNVSTGDYKLRSEAPNPSSESPEPCFKEFKIELSKETNQLTLPELKHLLHTHLTRNQKLNEMVLTFANQNGWFSLLTLFIGFYSYTTGIWLQNKSEPLPSEKDSLTITFVSQKDSLRIEIVQHLFGSKFNPDSASSSRTTPPSQHVMLEIKFEVNCDYQISDIHFTFHHDANAKPEFLSRLDKIFPRYYYKIVDDTREEFTGKYLRALDKSKPLSRVVKKLRDHNNMHVLVKELFLILPSLLRPHSDMPIQGYESLLTSPAPTALPDATVFPGPTVFPDPTAHPDLTTFPAPTKVSHLISLLFNLLEKTCGYLICKELDHAMINLLMNSGIMSTPLAVPFDMGCKWDLNNEEFTGPSNLKLSSWLQSGGVMGFDLSILIKIITSKSVYMLPFSIVEMLSFSAPPSETSLVKTMYGLEAGQTMGMPDKFNIDLMPEGSLRLTFSRCYDSIGRKNPPRILIPLTTPCQITVQFTLKKVGFLPEASDFSIEAQNLPKGLTHPIFALANYFRTQLEEISAAKELVMQSLEPVPPATSLTAPMIAPVPGTNV